MGDQVTYVCTVCSEPVRDGDGYLAVSVADAAARIRQRRASIAARTSEDGFVVTSFDDLREWPEDARWHALHAVCDPEPEGSSYTYEVHRARTAKQLLARTFHLQEKNWYEGTDWPDFVGRAMADSGNPLTS